MTDPTPPTEAPIFPALSFLPPPSRWTPDAVARTTLAQSDTYETLYTIAKDRAGNWTSLGTPMSVQDAAMVMYIANGLRQNPPAPSRTVPPKANA